jgi:dienelactone hydrolase
MQTASIRRAGPLLAVAMLLVCAGVAQGAIRSSIVTYKSGQVVAQSFLIYDDSQSGKRPGILVVPEWWGLNDYARTRARMLAGLGYVAMAVDIYGDGKNTRDRAQAAAWSGELKSGDRTELRARVVAALEELKRNPNVDPTRTAAIGYCFGGTCVLELARSGADATGVVSFHGGLDTANPAKTGEVKARLLVCHGAEDPFESPAQVQAFEDEMRKARADWQINIYSGAEHSFTNPANVNSRVRGIAYNKEADQRSWQAMRDFFKEIFRD